jgi:hypothetical protein
MSEAGWTALFRTPNSTVTKAIRSPAFSHSRAWAGANCEDPAALRRLAEQVEALDHESPPLCTVSDRVTATVRLVRATADRLDGGEAATADEAPLTPQAPGIGDRRSPANPPAAELVTAVTAGTATRKRLLVAALHYLITPDDLVPDFRPGGYIDDVLLLTWVFGAATQELDPLLE